MGFLERGDFVRDLGDTDGLLVLGSSVGSNRSLFRGATGRRVKLGSSVVNCSVSPSAQSKW